MTVSRFRRVLILLIRVLIPGSRPALYVMLRLKSCQKIPNLQPLDQNLTKNTSHSRIDATEHVALPSKVIPRCVSLTVNHHERKREYQYR